jgi:hypothetical protein
MRQLERERGEARELVELPSGVPRLLEDSVLSPSKDGVLSLSKETPAPYVVGPEEELLLPADDAALREVIRALFSVDVANLTPVQALVQLNEWQRRLRGRSR